VAGEVYHVDNATLAALDRLEGINSGMYTREVIDIIGQEPNVKAYIYVGGPQWHQSGCPVYRKTNKDGALDWMR
jgi:gamma-glutamylcyclotransferase (GGCT)/AIG2-like uncharacterized protein YtfP